MGARRLLEHLDPVSGSERGGFLDPLADLGVGEFRRGRGAVWYGVAELGEVRLETGRRDEAKQADRLIGRVVE